MALRMQKPQKGLYRGNFRFFLSALWQQLGLPPPTKAQLAIAEMLQHGPDRFIIMAFRGVGKIYISAAFAPWNHFRIIEAKVSMVSASKDEVAEVTISLKHLLEETPWLACL
ncbi:hypothetical protein OMCYN_01746 [cyanobiont of Ornithocercus magnificus]|nr:hypothetical protein OMCYN_01746 [cyanobiont of Ornithocercus magnificus]